MEQVSFMDESIIPWNDLATLTNNEIIYIQDRKQLKWNHRDDDKAVIKNEPFIVEKLYEEEGANPLPVATTEKLIPKIKDSDVLTTVNKELAYELSSV